ncbi:Crp/Fnr family transcriptional regulator [Phytomonospora sp. NPDC050363]|uniref:Crp/Fnr family transcriptional regulator n=1 Tax=Phytomonospora sp. NPDC050363 TaxID=3155642 RepID=UPI0033F86C4C
MTSGHDVLTDFLRTWGDLPETELAKVADVFRAIDVPARTTLVMAGEQPTSVHFSVTGLVRVFYVDENGTERTKAFRGEGELVCAYTSILRRRPSNVHIETLEPSHLLVATRAHFDQLLDGHPAWRSIISRLTERLLVQEEQRHAELLRYDAGRRYENFITDNPALAARLTQRLIASYIGVTPVALSRIRARR